MTATTPNSNSDAGQPPWLEVRAAAGWPSIGLRQVWEYRQLVYFFAWRDIKVRYKQTVLGAAWAILQPLLTMVVFTLIFGNLAQISSDGTPYAIWSYCGLLPWQYFTFVVTQSANSLVSNQNLLKKVYFPRLAIPLSIALAGLVDLAIAFFVLAPLMLWFEIIPTWKIVFLPPLVMLAMAAGLGVGLWASALNVQFRDVRYVIPFFVQFWLFISPIVYPASRVPATYDFGGWEIPLRTLYGLNPMVSVVEGFRWTLLDTDVALGASFWLSLVMALLLLVSGLYYFRRMERQFADIV